jgi:hypothetical protein
MAAPYDPEPFERASDTGSRRRARGRDRLTRCHVELSAGRFVNAWTPAMGTPEKGIRRLRAGARPLASVPDSRDSR